MTCNQIAAMPTPTLRALVLDARVSATVRGLAEDELRRRAPK